MRSPLSAAAPLLAACALPLLAPTASAPAACCYFSAKDRDVNQPAQKAFLTWDAAENVETFTVQPRFEGNADDFGMVIPTPSRPKLDEMPRDFFKELAVFTILEPMDMAKYKQIQFLAAMAGPARDRAAQKSSVKVLEAGVVGSLDYKIVKAEDANDLFQWLKDNNYSYAGDEKALDFYVKKGWYFTTMKIDPKQMKKRPDGSYEGEVTPTRFTFSSDKLVYPLRITSLSVKDNTEALFYVQAAEKMDLPGEFSWQYTFAPMWSQATSFAIPEKLSDQEKAWLQHVQPRLGALAESAQRVHQARRQPATLEWAKKITDADVAVMSGEKPFNREAPREDVEKLKLLRGHVKKGQFVTKVRKVFAKEEMTGDLEFLPAKLEGKKDEIEYYSILPTSPP